MKQVARTRHLGGLVFTSHGPGQWIGADGRLALLHMMQGTTLSEWHLFRTRPGNVPADPFADPAFWSWDDLSYTLTMGEMNKWIRVLRDRSAALLPRLREGQTIVRCASKLRLVTKIHPDGDGVGAVLDVEAPKGSIELDEQWSTYGCEIEDLPASWPTWQRKVATP